MRLGPVDVADLGDQAVVVDQVGGAALGAGELLDGAGEHLRRFRGPGGPGAVDQQLPDDVGRREGGRPLVAGPCLLDHAAEVRAGCGGEPSDVLGEGLDPGAVERQYAGDVGGAAQGDRETGGDVELVDPPAGEQTRVLVGRHGLAGPEHALGEVHADGGVAEPLPGLDVAPPVGVGRHAGHELAVLEQEDAGPVHPAERGQAAAGGGQEVVHRAGRRRRLDEAHQDLGLGQAPGFRAAGPCLGQGARELRGDLPEQVGSRSGRGFDGEDADHLAVADERLGVRGADAAAGQVLVGRPAAVGAPLDRTAVAHDRREEGGAAQRQGGAQVRDGPALGGVGDGLAEGDRHLRRRLVHEDGDAGGTGVGAQPVQHALQGGGGVVRGGEDRDLSVHAVRPPFPRHEMTIGTGVGCLSGPRWITHRGEGADGGGVGTPPVEPRPGGTGDTCCAKIHPGRPSRPAEPPACPREGSTVTYVITQPCVDVLDKACIDECPVDCIYEGERMLYIHPDECVDCGACEPVCPVEAIYYEDDTPDKWKDYYNANVEFFSDLGSPGGAAKTGKINKDHPLIAALPPQAAEH